ncbi:hypothetical protein CGLAUT_11965 [Corynebacterium glaucum]|nr:hypothetical protein CGLAUT_11965 [Corynebacterium glaucum]
MLDDGCVTGVRRDFHPKVPLPRRFFLTAACLKRVGALRKERKSLWMVASKQCVNANEFYMK